MKWYPWLNASYRQWVDQLQQGRGHHAILLQALQGMGAESLVWAISRWLMCQQPDGYKSCGKCHACQLMEAGTHPDWYAMTPEKGKTTLGVDAVRTLTEKLYHHAQQGGARVVWFPDAAVLTEASANALLKTVEEPPGNSWFIFSASQPARLMPTLRSRCQHKHLSVPAESVSLAWLSRETQVTQTDSIAALRLSAGAPVAALTLLDEKIWHARHVFCQKLADCLAHTLSDLLPALTEDDVIQRIDWLCTLLIDAMKLQQGGNVFIRNTDQTELVALLAERHNPTRLHECLQIWTQCRYRFLTVPALNRELLLAECLLKWQLFGQPTPVM
ncbi:MAG: DNA polymerase III subunit delta' [Candidatus Erwinia impunctatus]|nr:DNA polymerase III subunit delta' [Culicoides impunctatus]